MNYRKEINLTDFITALTNSTTGLSAGAFSGELTALVPYFVLMIPLAFGIRLIFKVLRKAPKGKVI